jgi:hypothetical protein
MEAELSPGVIATDYTDLHGNRPELQTFLQSVAIRILSLSEDPWQKKYRRTGPVYKNKAKGYCTIYLKVHLQ